MAPKKALNGEKYSRQAPRKVTLKYVTVKCMHANWYPGHHCSQPSECARLRCVRVHNHGPLTTKKLYQSPQRFQISTGGNFAGQRIDLDRLQASFVSQSFHAAFPRRDLPGQK